MARGTQPGTIIGGRYRLVEHLANAGLGRLWRAHDERLGADVAAREVWLPPAASERDAAERLAGAEHQARLVMGLHDHPNIVKVRDFVVDDGTPWIITSLVLGRPLAQCVTAERGLTVDEATAVAGAVLDALDTAHRAGVVHRAVSPASVILGERGSILLTDFGVAADRTDATVAQAGSLVGAIEYLAPECVDGGPADTASDLYALGATLYHAVERISPFRRDGLVATLNAVLREEAPPPRHAGHLAPLITSLMAKDPQRRPSVADARSSLTVWPSFVEQQPAPTQSFSAFPSFEPTPPPTGFPSTGFPPTGFPPTGFPPDSDPGFPPTMAGFPGAGQGGAMGGYPTFDAGMPPRRPLGAGATAGKTLAVLLAVAAVVTLVVVLQSGHGTSNTGTGYTPRTTAPAWTPPPYTPQPYPTYPVYPTYQPPTSYAPVVPDLDEATTDTTPLTASALLPVTFRDTNNVVFTLVGNSVRPCVNEYEGSDVRNALSDSGCTSLVSGSYLDQSDQILVSVWVVPTQDMASATTAYDALQDVDVNDWGISCPAYGTASELCTGNSSAVSAARKYGWTGVEHRYLIHSTAVEVDLSQSSSVDPTLNAASDAAETDAGPENYYDSAY